MGQGLGRKGQTHSTGGRAGGCYGLNICVPLKSIRCTPNPYMRVFGGVGLLGRAWGMKAEPSKMGSVPL